MALTTLLWPELPAMGWLLPLISMLLLAWYRRWGCVIGGFILGLLESFVNLWSAQWREVAIFALVILVLAFKPNGLFGSKLVEKV